MMMYIVHLRNDLRQIARDPVMLILMLAPLLIVVVFRLLITFLIPFLSVRTEIVFTEWYPYLLSFVLLMIPGLLGIVTGFLMLDDRDGHIEELYSVTPMGHDMYLINRLALSALLSVVYTFVTYFVLQVWEMPVFTLFYLSLMLASESAIIALLLYKGADDKVKGLAYAKGLNILNLFAFADLFSLKWLTGLAWFFPSYWITSLIMNPHILINYSVALIVHGIWLALLIISKR